MAKEELPNDTTKAVDIPDLKKKEKERKKSGAAWGQGAKGANAWEGAVGGNGAGGGVARAAASAAGAGGAAGEGGMLGYLAELAQNGGFFSRMFARLAIRLLSGGGGPIAQFFGRIAAALAEFGATALGQIAMAAAAAIMIGGAAIVGMALFGRGGGGAGEGGLPSLGDISSSIRVNRNGDMSGLDMARNGGLDFAGNNANKGGAGSGAPTDAKTADAKADGAGEAANGEAAGGLDNANIAAAQKDRLAHDMSMSKLSGSLGQGGTFGGKSIFSGGPQLGRGFNGNALKGFAKGNTGGAAASRRARTSATSARRIGAFRGSRALGRLQQMATLNNGMRNAGTQAETASTIANDQFDGQKTNGGTPPASPTGGPGTTGPTGGPTGPTGGPTGPTGPTCTDPSLCGNGPPPDACLEEGKMSDGNGGCIDPTVGNYGGANPWAGAMQGIMQMINSAKSLLLVASVLYLAAVAWFATGCCAYVGAIIMAIVATIMSIVITVMANNIEKMADQIGGQGQKMLSDGFKDIAGDLKTGAWTAVAAGIGGFWFYGQVTQKVNAMQGMMDEALKPTPTEGPQPTPGPGGSSNNA